MALFCRAFSIIFCVALLAACSSDITPGPCDVDFSVSAVTVTDHIDPLTDDMGNNAFSFTVDSASGQLPVECLLVAAKSATSLDTNFYALEITHVDNDADGMFSQGDEVIAVEYSTANHFFASDNGQTMDVKLLKDWETTLLTITWTDA